MKALIWQDEELRRQLRHRRHPGRAWPSGPTSTAPPLIDAVCARTTTSILEKYLGDGGPDHRPPTSRRPSAKATIPDGLVPVLTGSAFKNKGVQPLLDAVVDYLPVAPSTCPPTTGINLKGNEELERTADDTEPFSALAFKIVTDPYVGKLTYFRVYSGQLDKGGAILNARTGKQGARRPHPR